MAATLEKIYEVALHHYHMKLIADRGRTLEPGGLGACGGRSGLCAFLKRTGTDRDDRQSTFPISCRQILYLVPVK